MAQGPLAGLRVIDLTELGPGPFFTAALAELGADVVKIERPPDGDRARRFSPGGHAVLNVGKSSLLVDLKDPQGVARVRELVAGAGVLAEGYRPGVTTRLGLSYDELARVNPRLVYVSVSGYGQTGPLATEPGHDLNYLATSGMLALSGGRGQPPTIGVGFPLEFGASLYALSATLAAVMHAERTGEGQHLDVSITDCMIHWLNPTLAQYQHLGLDDLEAQREAAFSKPAYAVFGTSDGQWIAIAAMEEHFWQGLCRSLDLDLSGAATGTRAERVAAADEINSVIAEAVRKLSADDAIALLRSAGVPVSRMVSPADLRTEPHGVERGLWASTADGYAYARFPVRVRGS